MQENEIQKWMGWVVDFSRYHFEDIRCRELVTCDLVKPDALRIDHVKSQKCSNQYYDR